MRILVENGCYRLGNMGDVAMLQVAVARLSNLWPDASIEVITDRPDLLAAYCPNTHPIAARGRHMWFRQPIPFAGFLYRPVFNPIAQRLLELERKIRIQWPSLAHAAIQLRMKLRGIDIESMSIFLRAVLGADLVVVSGGGDINYAFKAFAMTLLDVLAMAIRHGRPTVMFGQGFGPIQDPELGAMVRNVLPSLDLVCIRESRAGLPLLASLGVFPARIVTTGDDAIELAYQTHATELGTGIGVNLRIAAYSEVNWDLIDVVRTVLHDAARKYHAPLIPVPISRIDNESDARTIRHVLAGYNSVSDGGQSLDTPLKVIEQVGRCRIVVTGSYHAAVFALAQGIPVVGLTKSAYYVDKFLGLADQFCTGCEIISLGDGQLREKLLAGIDMAWRSAEHVRSQLLGAATRQIESGRAAYRQIYKLVTCRKSVA